MKKITFLFSILTLLLTSCGGDDTSNNDDSPPSSIEAQFLTTNTLKVDDVEYDLAFASVYDYGMVEEGIYGLTFTIQTEGPGTSTGDFEWKNYAALSFGVYSEMEILESRTYSPSSLSDGIVVNHFPATSYVSTGFNDQNFWLKDGVLTVSQNEDNTYFELDYVGVINDSTIIIHYEGDFEYSDFSSL